MLIEIRGLPSVLLAIWSVIVAIIYILNENAKNKNNIVKTKKKRHIPTTVLIIANILIIIFFLHDIFDYNDQWLFDITLQIDSPVISCLVVPIAIYIIYFLLLTALMYRILSHKRDKIEKLKDKVKKNKYVVLYYIFIAVMLLLLLFCIFFAIDYMRVQKNELPIFCIRGESYLEGGTTEYYGIGYKVIAFHKYLYVDGKYEQRTFEFKKIGPWNMTYEETWNEIKENWHKYSYYIYE